MSPAACDRLRPPLKRRTILLLGLLCAGLLVAPVGVDCIVDDSYDRQYTGVGFEAPSGQVTFPIGQAVTGQVVSPGVLGRHGLTGTRPGDAIEATWQGGQRFTFKHPASGRSVTIVFPNDKVLIRSR
ncbi:MAG: hypothetical protein IH627_17655 [Rubrivivax sp.]|nr:hypothetical protein [Rubrivivax sp.]